MVDFCFYSIHMVSVHTHHNTTTIVLQPNRSASWLQAKTVVIIMTVFVMTVAIAWSFVGAWVVLPFAGLEVGLLAFFMHKVNYRCHQQQVITVAPNEVIVTAGVNRPEYRHAFRRPQAHVTITEDESDWHIPALTLQDDQHTLKLGPFLNLEDCGAARQKLSDAGLMVCSNRWWKKSA